MSTLASPSQRKDLSVLGIQLSRGDRLPPQLTIRKAYKARALELHPDMPNGDSAAFVQLQDAYQCLTSPEKKPHSTTGSRTPTTASSSSSSPAAFSSSRSNNRQYQNAAPPFSSSLRGNQQNRFSFTSTTPKASHHASSSASTRGHANPSLHHHPHQPPPFGKRDVLKPFPAFLSGGHAYVFETDPSAFGDYSRYLRHGDTARIDLNASSSQSSARPSSPQEHQHTSHQQQLGVVVGVAADGNLYWWKLDPALATLDTEATVLAPRHAVSPTSTRFCVIKAQAQAAGQQQQHQKQQKPGVSSPTASSSSASSAASRDAHGSNCHSRTSSDSSASQDSLASSVSGGGAVGAPGFSEYLSECVEEELEDRAAIEQVRETWLGEATWCFNLPLFAQVDAQRFCRTTRG